MKLPIPPKAWFQESLYSQFPHQGTAGTGLHRARAAVAFGLTADFFFAHVIHCHKKAWGNARKSSRSARNVVIGPLIEKLHIEGRV
jgi:hypothetical protein